MRYWIGLFCALSGLLIAQADATPALSTQTTQAELAEASELHKKAEKLIEDEAYEEALPSAQRALSIREKLLPPDHLDLAASASALGVIYLETDDLERATPLLKRALAIRERKLGSDTLEIIDDLLYLSDLYRATSDSRNLQQVLARVVSIREKAGGPDGAELATALNDLGLFYLGRNNYARAEPLFKRALAIREKALQPDDPLRAQSLNNLAAVSRDKGDYATAEPLFKQALVLRENAPGQGGRDLASSLNNLAGLYQLKGDYEQAEPLFKRALEIRETEKAESAPVAESLNNLGLLYKQKTNFDGAVSLYERAITMREKILNPDHPLVAQTLNNLGALYLETGDYDRASPLLLRALAIREKALGGANPGTAQTISNLGTLAFFKGNYSTSQAMHQRALAIFERSLGPQHPLSCLSRNNLAQIYTTSGKLPLARRLLSRNSDFRERNLTPVLSVGSERDKLSYISTLSEETDFTVSFNSGSLPRDARAARVVLTRVFRLKGRVVDAMADSVNALLRRADPGDRSLIEELSAARSQLAALVLRGPGGASLAEHTATISNLETDVRRLEEAISARSAAFRAQSRAVTFEQVQRAIPAGAALVEIVSYRPFNRTPQSRSDLFGPARYAAYVVRKSGEPRLVELGEARTIDTAIEAWRSALQRDENKPLRDVDREVKPLARAVDEKVMRPVRKLLSKTRNVFLSPDGALNLIPFAALVDERNQYLVKRYSFTYLTSGRDLLRLQVRAPGKQRAMLIADPDFGDNSTIGVNGAGAKTRSVDFTHVYFPPLPGTNDEGLALKGILPASTLLMRKAATETAVKRVSGPDILHVATHGFFLDDLVTGSLGSGRGLRQKPSDSIAPEMKVENPLLRSGLAMAGANLREGGNGEDGILTAFEAAGLDLWGTRLVVLSACDTGVGEVKTGDGVYGLRRALVLAGAETQVISLWQVSDIGTRDLMIEYYRQLQSGKNRSGAMRAVQLKMLAGGQHIHPHYWASFIQSGEWRGIRMEPGRTK